MILLKIFQMLLVRLVISFLPPVVQTLLTNFFTEKFFENPMFRDNEWILESCGLELTPTPNLPVFLYMEGSNLKTILEIANSFNNLHTKVTSKLNENTSKVLEKLDDLDDAEKLKLFKKVLKLNSTPLERKNRDI